MTGRPVSTRTCEIEGCERKYCAKGLCANHYNQKRTAEGRGAAANAKYRQSEGYRDVQMRSRLGISLTQYEQLLTYQNHSCAVCGAEDPGKLGWHVDHDHRCHPNGRACRKCIRGILCANCNLAIGNARDNPLILHALASYLIEWNTRGPGSLLEANNPTSRFVL